MSTSPKLFTLHVSMAVTLFLSAAIFGFFYAWICSTMWGLDTLDPRTAITAMNAMNDSVRNAVFTPSFFGTPLALIVTALLALWNSQRSAALLFAGAAILYFLGAFVPTAAINVPMNREMIEAGTPETLDAAQAVWSAYSPRWQAANIWRTIASGLVFGLGLLGLVSVVRNTAQPSPQ